MPKAKTPKAEVEKIEEVATPEVAPQPSSQPTANDKHKVDSVSCSITGKTFTRYTY